jgi:hypothetical protein
MAGSLYQLARANYGSSTAAAFLPGILGSEASVRPLRSSGAMLGNVMCRNIRPLFNFEPPATDEEVFAAALQYVRKVSNQRKPSGKNLITFDEAVQEIASVTRRLVDSLETTASPKNREEEAAKAKARSAVRFGRG